MAARRAIGPRGAWLMASVFFATGAVLLAVACGLIARDRLWGDTPRWVVAAAGLLFGAGGCAPLSATGQLGRRLGQWMGLLAAFNLAAIFHWIAFGPGSRHFSGGLSVFGIPADQVDHNERAGRLYFGIFAVLLDLLLVLGVWRLLKGRPDDGEEPQ